MKSQIIIGTILVAMAVAAIAETCDTSMLTSVYAAGLRGPLFSAFLSLGGFLFALKTFTIVKMKELVYDDPAFVKFVETNRTLNPSVSHYGPLQALSNLLFVAILSCFLTAVLQFTVGMIPSHWAVVSCLVLAAVSIFLIAAGLFIVWANLRRMFKHIEAARRGKLVREDTMNPKELILDAQKEALKNGKKPTVIVISCSMAIDIAKLSHNDIGTLSGDLAKYGYRHLESVNFVGLKVRIDPEAKTGFCFEYASESP